MVVTRSRELTSQQRQPTLHHVKPCFHQATVTSNIQQSTSDLKNYAGGKKKHFLKTKEQSKTNKKKLEKKKNQLNNSNNIKTMGISELTVWGTVT